MEIEATSFLEFWEVVKYADRVSIFSRRILPVYSKASTDFSVSGRAGST
jgi:hypothetical protein